MPAPRDRLQALGADTLLYDPGVSGASTAHVEKLVAEVRSWTVTRPY